MTDNTFLKTLLLIVYLAANQLAQAQKESPPVGPSYKERLDPRLSKSGPLDADPNVYVYTPEFAKRFQMPEEWKSTELKGVDVVAFRVVPSYKWCGWGGDLRSIQTDGVTRFDVDSDGFREVTEWVGNTDAMLGMDRDGDGLITIAGELFNGALRRYTDFAANATAWLLTA